MGKNYMHMQKENSSIRVNLQMIKSYFDFSVIKFLDIFFILPYQNNKISGRENPNLLFYNSEGQKSDRYGVAG